MSNKEIMKTKFWKDWKLKMLCLALLLYPCDHEKSFHIVYFHIDLYGFMLIGLIYILYVHPVTHMCIILALNLMEDGPATLSQRPLLLLLLFVLLFDTKSKWHLHQVWLNIYFVCSAVFFPLYVRRHHHHQYHLLFYTIRLHSCVFLGVKKLLFFLYYHIKHAHIILFVSIFPYWLFPFFIGFDGENKVEKEQVLWI